MVDKVLMQPDNIVLQRQMVRWGGAAVLTDHTNNESTDMQDIAKQIMQLLNSKIEPKPSDF